MAWHNAPSVAAALKEATRRWPKRATASDGTIGNDEHATRKSDHNPDAKGTVHAFDLTHDPTHDVDCEQLTAHLIVAKDSRVEYIIWNRRICYSKDWTWQTYTGKNPHTKHLHVSIKSTTVAENDTSDWWSLPVTSTPPAVRPEAVRLAIIKAHSIIERTTWGAMPPKKALVPDGNFDSIVLHHSGNWGTKDPKAIEKEHRGKGFDDVGYHYLIHPDGRIFEGRSILFKGEHVAKANTRKIGVLMMGDYDQQWWDIDDELTQSHLKKLKSLMATLKKHFTGIKYLGGHLEFAAAQGAERSCPGNLLMEQMASLRTSSGLLAPAA